MIPLVSYVICDEKEEYTVYPVQRELPSGARQRRAIAENHLGARRPN